MKKPMKMKQRAKAVKRVKGKIVEKKDIKVKKITKKAFGKMKKAPMKVTAKQKANLPANLVKEIAKKEGVALKMKKAAMKLKKESAMMLKKSMAAMKKVSAMKLKMKKSPAKKREDVQKKNADAMRATLQPGFKGSPKATENTKKFLKRHGLKSVPSRVDITGKRHVAEFLAKKKKK